MERVRILVKRALELEQTKHKTPQEIDEYRQIMDDPYIYDKVCGLKQGGII